MRHHVPRLYSNKGGMNVAANKKFQLIISDEAKKTLDMLKEKTGRETYSDVIRDAVKAYVWMVSEYENGREVLSRPLKKDATPFNPLIQMSKSK